MRPEINGVIYGGLPGVVTLVLLGFTLLVPYPGRRKTMAVRTTEVAVAGIIEVDAAIPTTPFIEAANNMVTKHCTHDDYTATDLELIERWLAAHFYTVRDMRAASETVKGVGEKKQSKVDLGLATSHYGQQAMMLDWAGGLAQWNEAMKKGFRTDASVVWAGVANPDLVETE